MCPFTQTCLNMRGQVLGVLKQWCFMVCLGIVWSGGFHDGAMTYIRYIIFLTISDTQAHCNIYRISFAGCQPRLITSHRGQPLLLYGQYTYSKHHMTLNKICWYCSSTKAQACKARVYTDFLNAYLYSRYDHTHPPPSLRLLMEDKS